MVTPELIEYIRSEQKGGRTREEISIQAKAGGWTEIDLSEAFRIVNQKTPESKLEAQQNTLEKKNLMSFKKSKINSEIVGLIVLSVLVCVGWYFYHEPVSLFLKRGWDDIKAISPNFPFGKDSTPGEAGEVSVTPGQTSGGVVKNCGIGVSPDPKNPSTYEDDDVLRCMGERALSCEDAILSLEDDILPTIVEIKGKDAGACNFKISYRADSPLVDRNGDRLALQYIECPIASVKAVNEGKEEISFTPPHFTNPSRYAAEIYFYGTLGVFMEKNMEKNKIESLGCRGSYIDSILESYRMTQSST